MRKKYVYDLPTRILHAGLGLTTLLLLLTAALAHWFYETGPIRHDLWMIHIFLGNLFVVFLLFRFVYFFIGPAHSRLSDLVKLNAWKTIVISFCGKKARRPVNWPWGHHPMASFLYLFVYLAFLIMSLTGIFLTRIQFDQGLFPEQFYDDLTWFTELLRTHAILAWSLLAFTVMHLSALFYHRLKDKLPVFESMRTGYQYRHQEDLQGADHEADQN